VKWKEEQKGRNKSEIFVTENEKIDRKAIFNKKFY